MKSMLLTGFLFWFAVGAAQKKTFEYGIQGGINLNKIYGRSPGSMTGSLTGLSIGGNVKLGLSKHFSLKAQPSYDQFGWVYQGLVFESGVFTNTQTDYISRISYLNLPILAVYSFGRKIKLSLDAGPYAGILLNYKITEKTQPPVPAGVPAETSYHSQYGRRFGIGVTAGLGVQIPLTPKVSINLSTRNYTGLTGVQKNNTDPKIVTLSFLTGLSFRL